MHNQVAQIDISLVQIEGDLEVQKKQRIDKNHTCKIGGGCE
jgi:hypothetical protein